MSKFREMHIAFCCDDLYAPYLCVTLASLRQNCCDLRSYHIWVVSAGMGLSARESIQNVLSGSDISLNFITVRETDIPENAPTHGHISLAAYYRILLPNLLPPEVDEVLYLDCDLLIEKDLKSLFDCDLEDNYLAAVTNPFFERWETLQLNPEWDYFNSGVLLLNLVKCREEAFVNNNFNIIAEESNHLVLHDQDTLNKACAGQWLRLSPVYNMQNAFYLNPPKKLAMKKGLLKGLKEDAVIVHYSSSLKPWLYSCGHPLKSLYYKYLDMTSLRGYRPSFSGVKPLLLRWRMQIRGLRAFFACK
ncbi:glycosyltransferase family 8 protein [Verrucomicrobiaceae bacterium 5K15]|uniref:Glycosyltransferase family 8 protein n=1 Tax=Oceaniferula flava TaxID=2800421 RepID=A0AAE2VAB6_9BACT|nr:glycosyltransferase family 8 protein [Oceaniferula flavus]MBK1856513.1 glycosyltransferase family 8 protein [Oceaniferula flavus]MBM1137820.1 glycosyltransferase family 8 protein [Oceaniferula flavus]